MLVRVALFAALLGGCSSQYEVVSVPAFPPEPIEANRDTVTVKVEWVSRDELTNMMSGKYLLSGRYQYFKARISEQSEKRFLGLTKLPTKEEPTCTIYALKPNAANDHAAIYSLGHEFLHCLAGNFH
jgi:hypothetical protein